MALSNCNSEQNIGVFMWLQLTPFPPRLNAQATHRNQQKLSDQQRNLAYPSSKYGVKTRRFEYDTFIITLAYALRKKVGALLTVY